MKSKSTLKKDYQSRVVPALMSEFGHKNALSVPIISKVVVNSGIGEIAKSKDLLEKVIADLALITGQKPSLRKARVSVAAFSVRKGSVVGLKTTLREGKMYEFLYKLINLAFPRVRDFRGISPKGFDNKGNFTVGLKEQLAFPEITAGMSDIIHGLEITIVTTAKNKEEGLALLKKLGFPFSEK